MEENLIEFKNVSFTYGQHVTKNEDNAKSSVVENDKDVISSRHAIKDINLNVKKGQFVVILGRNGSGKSTLARLINALLLPGSGTVYIKGMDTKNEGFLWEIRRTAGMIFQNPDNQIIGTIVEEDVAFGPENLGIEPGEIRRRVDEALRSVGIEEYREFAPHLLSGGQKQRVSIAGILAMKPECIILDEATAMLDPIGRKDILSIVKKLNKEEGITVIHITHYMDEAVSADRVVVIDKGSIVLDGRPKDVFSNVEKIKELGLDVPQVTEIFYELDKQGYKMPKGILDIEEACSYIVQLIKKQKRK